MSRDHIHIVDRFSAPNKFCMEPFSTIWRVKRDDNTYMVYLQVSSDELNPEWMRLGDILEKIYENDIEDDTFIADCLAKYLSK